jgi:hypothetical protein
VSFNRTEFFLLLCDFLICTYIHLVEEIRR